MAKTKAKSRKRGRIGKRYHAPGTSPGTLRAPEVRVEQVRITVIDYDAETLRERQVDRVDDLAAYRDSPTVTWINVEGLHDVAVVERIGELFGLHGLSLEDALNCGQRPKVEDYGDHHFLVMRSLLSKGNLGGTEQISFFLSERWVITFQEVPGDSFEAVRQRIRLGKGRIRAAGADYLAYALIDSLIDEFFPLLESYGDRLESLEDAVTTDPSPEALSELHAVKRELLLLRRVAWPEREVIHALQREEADLIAPETKVFLRDVYDHAIQVIDIIETYRDLAGGLLDVYLSSVSNRMNEVMKVLTIIATLFIPLTFIAGVYGMNFRHMPELAWRWGYPFSLALMAAVAAGLVGFFRRKGWF
jgi:magnesium transporter